MLQRGSRIGSQCFVTAFSEGSGPLYLIPYWMSLCRVEWNAERGHSCGFSDRLSKESGLIPVLASTRAEIQPMQMVGGIARKRLERTPPISLRSAARDQAS